MLLSILAFPLANQENALKAAAEALSARFMSEAIAANPASAPEWQAAYPDYAAIDNAECRRRLRELTRRLRDRMIASRMSLGFFQEAITKRPAKLPASMSRHTIKALSKLVLLGSGQKYAKNVRKRAWGESRPVIHLAAAMQISMRVLAPDKPRFGYSLDNLALHVAVIKFAQLLEEIVISDPRFGKNRSDLIRIRNHTGRF